MKKKKNFQKNGVLEKSVQVQIETEPLESVLQDGEFEYFWRSVRPQELKLCELKKKSIFDDFYFCFLIFKVIRAF